MLAPDPIAGLRVVLWTDGLPVKTGSGRAGPHEAAVTQRAGNRR
jgi:hypothetical protein